MTQQWLEGHRARKRFGQNFLHDRHWIERIARSIDPRPGDELIEIGPGQAALTREVVSLAGRETAVEIDRDLAAFLRTQFPPESLELIEADALTLDWPGILPGRRLRIFGNLPYNISSPILFALLPAAGRVIDQHFMLQREVVDRMTAAPGTKTYGRLSVMLQHRYVMHKLFDVRAHGAASRGGDPQNGLHALRRARRRGLPTAQEDAAQRRERLPRRSRYRGGGSEPDRPRRDARRQ